MSHSFKFSFRIFLAICLFERSSESVEEPYAFVNVAGDANDNYGYRNGTAGQSLFFGPAGVDLDREGNLYVADDINNAIRKVSPAGVVTTLAGSPAERDESGYPKTGFVDGFGSQARFNRPFDVAVDSAGNVFVADRGNNAIRKITPAGEVGTFTGGRWGFMDGAGTNAQFRGPSGIAVDAKDILYVAVMEAHTIRKITDPFHPQRIRVVTCEMMPLRLMRIRECEA